MTSDASSFVNRWNQAQSYVALDDLDTLPRPTSWREEGIMVGSPPPAEKRVSRTQLTRYPFSNWAFQNVRSLFPTANVPRGNGSIVPLPASQPHLAQLRFSDVTGKSWSLDEFQRTSYADALLVMHRGRLVHEFYNNDQHGGRPHLLNSASKSFTGLLVDLLVGDGQLDYARPASDYVPALAGSGYGDATVEQLHDMTVAIDYDRSGPAISTTSTVTTQGQYFIAMGLVPRPEGYEGPESTLDALPHIGKSTEGVEHGYGFSYQTPNTDTLAWIVRMASGESLSALLSDRIWSRLGAESDAYYMVDPAGIDIAAAGLNAAPRDLARFGMMLANGGDHNGDQVLPERVIDRVFSGGDRDTFRRRGYPRNQGPAVAGYAYRGQWWLPDLAGNPILARGMFGQRLFVDRVSDIVVVQLSTCPMPDNSVEPGHLAMYEAIVREFS